MKKLALLALAIMLFPGCTFHRGGSQALSFDPFHLGSDRPAVSVTNNREFSNGDPWDLR